MNGLLARLGYLAGRGKKVLAGLAGAIVAAGGIAVVAPGLPGQWQAVITGLVTIASVWSAPQNTPKKQPPTS